MSIQLNTYLETVRKSGSALVASLALGMVMPGAMAQDNLSNEFPELANLFNAFDVTQSELLDEVVSINERPGTQEARNQLESHLTMMANMTMSEMMAAGMGHGGHNMDMVMNGPYNILETESRANLVSVIRGTTSSEEAESAFSNSDVLDVHTATVFQRGRDFEDQLFEIYLDDSISDKKAAVDMAIDEYLSDQRHSVPVVPKTYNLLVDQPYATAFQTGFPKLSGLLWSNQWLELAALESILTEYADSQFTDTMEVALERYRNKLGSESGMSMFPAPSDLPMAATIAPHLYSFHPRAAIIIDNLNMLETAVADILAYPNLQDRESAMEAIVLEYTNKATNISRDYDYLLAALRGGIYNQGGPAVGELTHSERNRSRADMNMNHSMIMSAPQ